MPLFLRDLRGRTIPVPIEASFVEVRSADNKLAAVIFNNAEGVAIVAKPGDREFTTYVNSVGMLPAQHIPIFKPAEGA